MSFEISPNILIRSVNDLGNKEIETLSKSSIAMDENLILLTDKRGMIPAVILTGGTAYLFKVLSEKYLSTDKDLQFTDNLQKLHNKLLAKRIVIPRNSSKSSPVNNSSFSSKFSTWVSNHQFHKKAVEDKLKCRLKNEALTLQYLHKAQINITPQFHYYNEQDHTLSCEYITGTPLSSALNYAIDDKIEVSWKVIRAYEKLHSSNIIHGDVSINNILIKPNMEIALIDFEWARQIEKNSTLEIQSNEEEIPAATLFYCAPDIATAWLEKTKIKKSVTSELYSVASLIIHLLTKKPTVDPMNHLIKDEFLRKVISGPHTEALSNLRHIGGKDIADWVMDAFEMCEHSSETNYR